MPCRGPDDSYLYREASEKLAKQEGVNQETEEALCETSTLLIKILIDPNNSISLSPNESQSIEEIKARHLAHRVEELQLLLNTYEEEKQRAQRKHDKLIQTRIERESQGFIANETHINKESQAQENIRELQEKIVKLGHVLSSLEKNDSEMIQKVLIKTQ